MLSIPIIAGLPRLQAETEALAARFTAAPTVKRARVIDKAVKALKTSGVWRKADALYVFAAADTQAATRNWVQDLYNASLVSAPTFTADSGFAGNGTSSYVDSNFNPATASSPHFVRDSATFGFWYGASAAQTSSVAGFLNVSGVTRIPRISDNSINGRINDATPLASAVGLVSDGAGLHLNIRSGASAERLTKDGVTLASGTSASVAVVSGSFRFGSVSASIFNAGLFRAGYIGEALTTNEDAALYWALAEYLAAIAAP